MPRPSQPLLSNFLLTNVNTLHSFMSDKARGALRLPRFSRDDDLIGHGLKVALKNQLDFLQKRTYSEHINQATDLLRVLPEAANIMDGADVGRTSCANQHREPAMNSSSDTIHAAEGSHRTLERARTLDGRNEATADLSHLEIQATLQI